MFLFTLLSRRGVARNSVSETTLLSEAQLPRRFILGNLVNRGDQVLTPGPLYLIYLSTSDGGGACRHLSERAIIIVGGVVGCGINGD